MRATPNSNASVRPINHLFASLNEFPNITEPARTIRVREKRILAPHMSQSMRNAPTLAPIPLQGHYTNHIMQLMLPRKLQHHIHGPIRAPIIDHNDLIPVRLLIMRVPHRVSLRTLRRPDLSGTVGPADVGVEILDCLLERGDDAGGFVEGREDDGEAQLRGLDGPAGGEGLLGRGSRRVDDRLGFGGGARILGILGGLTLGEPAVVPAGKLGWFGGFSGLRRGGDVGFLGGEHGSRLWGDEVEEDEELSRPKVSQTRSVGRTKGNMYRNLSEQQSTPENGELNMRLSGLEASPVGLKSVEGVHLEGRQTRRGVIGFWHCECTSLQAPWYPPV